LASINGNLNIVRYLVDQGANTNAINKKKSTPLHCSAQKGDISIVEFLIDNGSDTNAKGVMFCF